MTHYQKGAGFERKLVRAFWDNGFAALRAAGSGSAPFDLPDVIAFKSPRIIAIECKTSSKDKFHLELADYEKLKHFSSIAGCESYLALKFDRTAAKFFSLGLMDAGTRTFAKSDISLSFEDLIQE